MWKCRKDLGKSFLRFVDIAEITFYGVSYKVVYRIVWAHSGGIRWIIYSQIFIHQWIFHFTYMSHTHVRFFGGCKEFLVVLEFLSYQELKKMLKLSTLISISIEHLNRYIGVTSPNRISVLIEGTIFPS